MTSDQQATDLKALISAAAKAPAHDLDELQKMTAKPANYVEVYLSRRAVGEYRADGSRDNSGYWRLSTRVVAKTVTNARLIEDRIALLFNLTTVTVASQPVQVDYESGGGDFEYDDGYYTALTDWIYAL